MTQAVPLVLGGHSFISQLRSDALATRAQQIAIVEAALGAGISAIDTTYQPERIALGHILRTLGNRGAVEIIAWNFFMPFGPGQPVGGPRAYCEGDIDTMLSELQTDHIEMLVVHDVADADENRRQLALAQSWQAQRVVDRLGIWHPGREQLQVFGPHNPYSFMVQPYSVTTSEAGYAFGAAKALWWETLATSPFGRGWELKRRAARLAAREELSVPGSTHIVADLMLRYALHQPSVDRVVVAMRRPEWVQANVASASRGPLADEESALLFSLGR